MATPKPSKAARAATKSGRLNRNVTRRNIPEVRKGSEELFKVLSKRENEAQAIELIKQYAMEADPSRPGYEGNEIIAPFIRAISQLRNDRRLELLEKAGNPEIFSSLPSDVMTDILPDTDFDAAREQLALEEAFGAVPEGRELPPQQNPTTFGGNSFRDSRKGMDRAPIDRDVSPDSKDPERARQQIITGIIGVPAAQEYFKAAGLKPKTGEPPVDPVTGFPMPEREPTLPEIRDPEESPTKRRQREDALALRLSDPQTSILRGAEGERSERLQENLERVAEMEIDPSAEPFAGVMDVIPAEARTAAGNELEPSYDDPSRPSLVRRFTGYAGPEDVGLQATQKGTPRPAGPVDSSRGFSGAPVSVPTNEIKNNAIARIQAELAEIQRRRAAFEANPPGAPIGQRAGMRPLMKGTLGLQAPYDPSKPHGMTVDQQLSQSTRSPADRIMEAIYRASEVMGASNDTDFGDYGKNDVRKMTDLAPAGPNDSGLMPGEIDLRMLPEAWYRYPQVDPATGEISYPDAAPTAEFLADQMVGWYGVEDADEFKRRAIPVLEYSLRRQAPLGPSSMGAYKASATVLQPNLRGGGKPFINVKDKDGNVGPFDPEFQEYAAARMFNPDVQMNRPPLSKAQVFGGGRSVMRRPEAPEPTLEELNAMLDTPVVDPVDALDTPVTGRPLEGLNDIESLDTPVEGGDLDLSMNRMRRGPLSALIV